MDKLERLDQTMGKLKHYRQFSLRVLIILLMVNYMVVTIMLRDFILLKFLRDFILIGILAVTLWKAKPKLFYGLLLLILFIITCIPAFIRSVSLSLGFTVVRRYLFPLVLFFTVYQIEMRHRLRSFFRFTLWLFAILSLWGIFQAHVLGDDFLMALGYPTQYAPHYQQEMLYNSYYFGGFGIQRVVMTLSNSNVCALILGSTLIFLLFGYSQFKSKKYPAILIGVIAVAYVLTFSRSNFLAMGIVVLLFALPYIPYKKQLLIALGALAVVAIIVGLFQGENGFLYKLLLWVRDSFTFKESSAAGRSGRWLTALNAVLRNPLGIGFGHVGSIASEAGVTEGYYSCENSFLAAALDTGWAGMLFYFGFVAVQAIRLKRRANRFRKNADTENERLCLSGFVIIIYFLIVFFFSNHIYDMEAMAIIYIYLAIVLKRTEAPANRKKLPTDQQARKDL